MAVDTIIANQLPLDATKVAAIQQTIASEGYSLLKEIVAARCAVHQISGLASLMYDNNGSQVKIGENHIQLAKRFQNTLDVLDELERDKEGWATVKIENRR